MKIKRGWAIADSNGSIWMHVVSTRAAAIAWHVKWAIAANESVGENGFTGPDNRLTPAQRAAWAEQRRRGVRAVRCEIRY